MICSFLAGRPGRDRPNAAGAARFCEWVFVMGETHTHARFCGVSLLAAAKLQHCHPIPDFRALHGEREHALLGFG